ncbi:MAG: hypothetical protein IJP77_06360 [Bacteroidales bacterium]|nr:hypothetical protein [Bacteroidales bacterium]
MNKKLRLLVTGLCPNRCPLCCNNRFNLEDIPVVEDIGKYDEINITGGEPLLFYDKLYELIRTIRFMDAFLTGKRTIIYLYTSMIPNRKILEQINGLCYTPHSKRDVDEFLLHLEGYASDGFAHLSLRLNLFPEVEMFIPSDVDLSRWKVKRMEWIKDCPVPEGEDFRRLKRLW